MAQEVVSVSRLSPAECVRRLEQLETEPQVRVTRAGKTTLLVVSRLAFDTSSATGTFELTARCSDLTYPPVFGGPVFVAAQGRLIRRGTETVVRAVVRPGRPTTLRDWLARLSWYLGLAPVIVVMLIAAIRVGDPRLWQIAGGFALVAAVLYARDFMLYAQGTAALAHALRRTLAE